MKGNTPLHLLKFFSIKDNYDSYHKYIKYGILAKEATLVLKDYKKYYKSPQFSDHTEIDFNLFITEFQNNWHSTNLTEDQHKSYGLLVNNIQQVELSTAQSCLPSFIAMETRDRINEFWENDFDSDKIRKLLDKHEESMSFIVEDTIDPDVWTFDDFDMTSLDKTEGLPFPLKGLTESLTSMTLETFIVMGAYTEVGKSALCLSIMVHVFKHLCKIQAERPILYFSSEGGPNGVGTRFLMALLRRTEDEIRNNYVAGMKYLFDNYDMSLLKVIKLRNKTIPYLERNIKKYNPSLIVLDMIDHLKGESDSKMDNNAENYQWAREMSGKVCPIIATTQCSNAAKIVDTKKEIDELVKWVPITAMHFSTVDKQGAAETIIMIGAQNHTPNERYINIVKAKRGAISKFSCKFNSKYATYEDF